jgi:hypothetical protein
MEKKSGPALIAIMKMKYQEKEGMRPEMTG